MASKQNPMQSNTNGAQVDAAGALSSTSLWQRRMWIEGVAIVAFWSLTALLSIARTAFDPHFAARGGLLEGEVMHTVLEHTLWAILTPLIFWMSSQFSFDRRRWLKLIPLYIIAGIAIAAFVDLVDHVVWNALVVGGSERPISIAFILGGFHVLAEFSLYFIVLIAGLARAFYLRMQENEQRATRLQAHLAEARLQALRMQINPHFLFNTLHVISNNFEEDPSVARRMIARLSEILRYTFQETDSREVVLAKELRFLDGYLDIQRYRFEDRLTITKDIDPEVRLALVPNLILQPLVENAIQHGVSQLEGPGHIELRAWREGDKLHLTVRDNGPGLTRPSGDGYQKPSSGIGLRNTRGRLKGLYGPNQRLTLQSPPEGGVLVHVTIPFHTESDYVVVAVDSD